MSTSNFKNYFKTNCLIIIILLVIVLGVIWVWYFSSKTSQNTFTRANANQNKKISQVNQSNSLANKNINEAKNNNQNINSSINYPSDWKEFQGEKLGFTIFIPPTWSTTSHFEQFNQPTDPVEPASYDIATRMVNDPMTDWTDDDVYILIKKFRRNDRSIEEIIQNDSRIYNLKLIKSTVIDGRNSQLYLREVKEGVGTESHISYVMYIEDDNSLFSINATYSNQERFDKLHRETVESIMQSFKKS